MRDIIVVGAGPAGSHAARRCAQLGLDTLLLDRATFPREKACAGVVGERAVPLIGPDVMAVVEVVGEGGDLFYDRRLLGRGTHHEYYVRRRAFDAFLAGRAQDAGVDVRQGVHVDGLEVRPDRAVVRSSAGAFEGQVVVGADGTSSLVGRESRLSLLETDSRYAALRAEIPTSEAQARALGVADPPRQATHFFSDLFGFAWIVPYRSAVNVGMGASVGKAAGLRQRFLEFLKSLRLEAANVRGAQIPYLPPRHVSAPRVLLTGDAGGFVDPWTGCGIEGGILASENAALTCKEAVDAGDFSLAAMRRFDDLCRSQLEGIRWRGGWIKFADRMTRPGVPFPFWVEHVVRSAVGLDEAPAALRKVGRGVTTSAPH